MAVQYEEKRLAFRKKTGGSKEEQQRLALTGSISVSAASEVNGRIRSTQRVWNEEAGCCRYPDRQQRLAVAGTYVEEREVVSCGEVAIFSRPDAYAALITVELAYGRFR